MQPLSRRIFLKAGTAAAAALPAVGTPGSGQAPQQPHGGGQAASAPYLFFSAPEAAFMEAAVDRLIPPDELGPGAREAGVVNYIDRQLAGAWGAGERLYRSGPWQAGSPSQGYQLPFTPAELFRNALRALSQQGQGATPFEKLPGEQQDAWLTRLQNGGQDLEGVPSKSFFESLLALTVEGYFSDPAYGGNRDGRSWAMIGFPGAYGNYYDLVDQHGIAFDVPPRSLAQDGAGHVHEMPAMAPAAAPRRQGTR
ncbi:MAG TPA: gluconate 2-dehydrogenase subunit 3 family protein [Ramlibacter sp.]|jgi:gluconate 2-dehydrogenase gamma chain|uniref:gluconate 2-dehydrogenase subunit 3 family protein n=1 Tax=Ramlibacter sp. TaxID=1917967 RepID=UPI002D4C1869|nr:gluconate 2-dehydrogenase subunit 3 family protein [Ramlibacter sp.]HZY18280.1 gluconate 2-dehydrogenase subunit 3 family protein [Ramlibacter sp.]